MRRTYRPPEPPCMPGIAPTPLSPRITLIITIQVLLQSTSSRSYALSVLNVLVAASKLESSRMFHLNITLQFETKEAADWFKQPDILLSILPRIDSSAKLKNRAYQILLPRVPVLRYCRNVRPTWVKFNSKDTKESEWRLRV